MTTTKAPFVLWLDRKFLAWQLERGERLLLKDFADWLGISNHLLSHYMNGRNVPTGENVRKLADKLGLEVYDLLGLARPPDDATWQFFRDLDRLTPENFARLRAFTQQLLTEQETNA